MNSGSLKEAIIGIPVSVDVARDSDSATWEKLISVAFLYKSSFNLASISPKSNDYLG